jgi:predicted transposase YdaD
MLYYIQEVRESTKKGEKDMTKAERNAYKARVKDLIEEGIDKMIAEAMAQAELTTGVIRQVVNYNE